MYIVPIINGIQINVILKLLFSTKINILKVNMKLKKNILDLKNNTLLYFFCSLQAVKLTYHYYLTASSHALQNQYHTYQMVSRNLIILVSLFVATHSIYISFGATKPLCLNVVSQPGMEMKFFYEIIGSDGTGHRVDFTPDNKTQDPLSQDTAKGKVYFEETAVQVCFVSTDGKNHSASFDYYSRDVAYLMSLALKSEVYDLHTKLIDIGEHIKEVNKNQNFEETRQSVFSEIVMQQEGRVQKFAFIKIVVIAVVAVGQLYLLKALLSKQDRAYQPV